MVHKENVIILKKYFYEDITVHKKNKYNLFFINVN